MVVGGEGNLAPRSADRREPEGSSAVEAPGSSRHQRPESSGLPAEAQQAGAKAGARRQEKLEDRPTVKPRRGRPHHKWVVRVTAIDAQTHPKFLRNSRHPCAGMKPEDRLEDLISFCARIWARTCEDVAKEVAETQRRAKAA